ncbi:MAG: hypothetical protein R3245_11160 [Kiloniellales bacterium]|nr:hypothetical protein [Kiloniellales bacterium]
MIRIFILFFLLVGVVFVSFEFYVRQVKLGEQAHCDDKNAAYTVASSLIKERYSDELLFFPHRSEIEMKGREPCGQVIKGYFTDSSARRHEYEAIISYKGRNYWSLEELSIE